MEDVKTTDFLEVQQFRQIWVWVLILPIALYFLFSMGPGIYQQLVLGQPWGRKPVSNTTLVIVGCLSALASLGVPLLLYFIKLITRVTHDHIEVYFYPFKREQIPFENIVISESRTYNAISEYGGWGIRTGRNGKAYNVSGNQGVQLELTDGKKLLIGSQRSDELAELIKQKRKSE